MWEGQERGARVLAGLGKTGKVPGSLMSWGLLKPCGHQCLVPTLPIPGLMGRESRYAPGSLPPPLQTPGLCPCWATSQLPLFPPVWPHQTGDGTAPSELTWSAGFGKRSLGAWRLAWLCPAQPDPSTLPSSGVPIPHAVAVVCVSLESPCVSLLGEGRQFRV